METKTCTGCGDTKPVDDFQWKVKAKGLRQPKCKPCARADSRAQHHKRLEERKAKQAAYRAANKERRAEYDRNYSKNNQAKIQSKQRRRELAKLQRTPLWADLVEIDYVYHAAQVIKDVYGTTWHVDHIVPLQGEKVSGLHVQNNLQLLSPEANLSKSNKFEVC